MQGGAKIGTANCVYKNCLYIVGGYNMGPVLSDVECFDLENKWLVIVSHINYILKPIWKLFLIVNTGYLNKWTL